MDAASQIAKQTAQHTRAMRLKPQSLTLGFGVLRHNLWLWPLLVAAMLVVAGLTIRRAVETAAQREMAEGLVAMLNSNVEALKIWLETEAAHATAAANEVVVRRLSGELKRLVDSSADPVAALLQSPLQEEFREAMRPVMGRKHFAGFALLDQNRRILASDRTELIGQIRSTTYDLLGKTTSRGATVTPPIPSPLQRDEATGEMRAGQPTMFAMSVQRDLTGDIVGILGLRILPDADFVRILQIARPGETGETYAFDENGLLLSESRFTKDLMRIGLVPDQAGAKSQLNISIRDPGVNLATGARPTKSRAEQPLTVMAASATKGESGINVAGYRDYRGVPVVGAWTWLADYDIGVATEKDVTEAYHSLYILRRAFWSMFGLLAASSILILVFSVAMARAQKAAQNAALAAKELGQYQLEEKLGEGGMGVVYRGRHRMLRRPTAIKLLHPDKTTREAIQRFEREVQLTCQLNHPNTIAIYDYGHTPEGIFYYAMEYLDGINLDNLATNHGPQPEGRVIHILRQICGSLAEAHEIGLVHRDIKPANIILCCRGGESDVAKVLDFGLVKAIDAKKESSLTSAGAVMGTPLYMSPESIEAADSVDGKSDLYAVAAVGYYLLTGKPPFDGKSVVEICMHHARTPPQPPHERLGKPVSSDLEAALLKGLAKKPGERFASARQFAEALAACTTAKTWTNREASTWWVQRTGNATLDGGPPTATVHQQRTLELTSASGN